MQDYKTKRELKKMRFWDWVLLVLILWGLSTLSTVVIGGIVGWYWTLFKIGFMGVA